MDNFGAGNAHYWLFCGPFETATLKVLISHPMSETRSPHPNTALLRARRRRALERKQASWLLGYKGPQVLAKYERGAMQPSLPNAIKLSLIYGCEMEEIFPDTYKLAREQIFEKTRAHRLIALDRIPELLNNVNRCTFEDALVDQTKVELHRGDIRDHITRLAKALAQI